MAAVLLHEVLDDAAHRAPDEVALVTDAGTQTFAELAGPGRAGRRGHRRRSPSPATGSRSSPRTAPSTSSATTRSRGPAGCSSRSTSGSTPTSGSAPCRRSGARVLIAESRAARAARTSAAARAAGVETIVGLDARAATASTASSRPARGRRRTDGHDDDVAWLIGTSGTTGTPKLAMLTHASLLAAVDATLDGAAGPRRRRVLHAVPALSRRRVQRARAAPHGRARSC